jgi:hypothetical protein
MIHFLGNDNMYVDPPVNCSFLVSSMSLDCNNLNYPL